MDAEFWDQRYDSAELIWTAKPNVFVAEAIEDIENDHAMSTELAAGRATALDLAAGEGRHAVWMASRGWHVLAVDFSSVGLDRAQQWAEARDVPGEVTTKHADAVTFRAPERFDVVVVAYLQLPAQQRNAALANAAEAVRPGGYLVVVAHDSSNLTTGSGGPQDPAVLYTAEEVCALIDGWDILDAGVKERVVATPPPARDAVVIARKPDKA